MMYVFRVFLLTLSLTFLLLKEAPMNKFLIAITMLFTLCIATESQAAFITREGTTASTYGDTFDYNYILRAQTGTPETMEVLGNSFLSTFINTLGINSGVKTLSFNMENFGAGSYILNFNKLAIPPVPLPAALPMFGMALAGLGFYKSRKKTEAK